MAAPAAGVEGGTSDVQLFRKLDDYPWDLDEEFQNGLRAILGPSPSPLQADQLTLRARCFYYSRYIFQVVYLNTYTALLTFQVASTMFTLISLHIRHGMPIMEPPCIVYQTLLHQLPPPPSERKVG